MSQWHVQALPQMLVHLNISRNAVTSLAGIEGCINLQWLDASCNHIQVRAFGTSFASTHARQ